MRCGAGVSRRRRPRPRWSSRTARAGARSAVTSARPGPAPPRRTAARSSRAAVAANESRSLPRTCRVPGPNRTRPARQVRDPVGGHVLQRQRTTVRPDRVHHRPTESPVDSSCGPLAASASKVSARPGCEQHVPGRQQPAATSAVGQGVDVDPGASSMAGAISGSSRACAAENSTPFGASAWAGATTSPHGSRPNRRFSSRGTGRDTGDRDGGAADPVRHGTLPKITAMSRGGSGTVPSRPGTLTKKSRQ